MITEMYMPKNGMDMTEGTIIRWLRNVGDRVEKDEPIMEIETDKISMEAEAPGSGILLRKLYNDGDTVPVLTVLGYIGEPDDKLPDAPAADSPESAEKPGAAEPEKEKPAGARPDSGAHEAATPNARRMAAEKGIALSSVEPSGSAGQITARDVENAAHSSPLARAVAADTGAKLNAVAGSGENGRVMRSDVSADRRVAQAVEDIDAYLERRKLTAMRKVIAKRMLQSHAEVPTVTQNTSVDVTALAQLRREYNEQTQRHVSFNDFIVRAAALAAGENERVRMRFAGDEYELTDRVNIGVAVSTDDGLLVPVVRDANRKTVGELSDEIKALADGARSNRLRREDLGGAVMTVSNLGMFGVHSFTPIINQPESCILGVCAMEDVLALAGDGSVEVRKKMMLCLTYDHRIMNGTEAAAFSNRLKSLLEAPMQLLR